MAAPHLVTADELVSFANSFPAAEVLPELMLRLVLASTEGVAYRRFPTGKGIYHSGFDGEVRTEKGNAYVPDGHSIWEVSTEQDVERKATADLKKRAGQEIVGATYVGVALRRFNRKKVWAANAERGPFREIRLYDVDDLYAWLLSCPAVHYWLSARLGHPVDAVTTLDDWWKGWANCTNPAMEPAWMVAGRQGEADSPRGLLAGRGITCISAESEDEALAFLYCSLASESSDEDERMRQRTLIVHSSDALRHLTNRYRDLVLVPVCDLTQADIGNAEQTHRIVLTRHTKASGTVRLPRPDRFALAKALQDSGLDYRMAVECARLGRRGWPLLRERLGAPSVPFVVDGAPSSDRTLLTAALLASQWDDSSAFDREVLAELAGVDYDQLSDWVATQSEGPVPLLRRTGSVYFLTDPGKAWRQFCDSVAPSVMKRFTSFAVAVLGHYDSSYELDPGKRWLANLYGKGSQVSYHLREGVARTLAVLATQELSLPGNVSGQGYADDVVRQMLDESTPDRWYSIAGQLPLLAEASPEQFLRAVEKDLSAASPAIVTGLDAQADEALRDGSRSHDLLWALERLAWSRDYLLRVALILARLDTIGFGRSGNNPFRSLREIFLPWHPCTNTNVDDRLQVIDRLRKQFPDTAWRLLLSQLPEVESTALPTSRTRVRGWSDGLPVPQMRADISKASQEALGRAIADAGTSVDRWSKLGDAILHMNQGWNVLYLQALADRVDEFPGHERDELWRRLREKWHHYRVVSDATWALQPEVMEALETLLSRIEPDDPCLSNAWLFEEWVTLPEPRVKRGYREREQEELDARRREVVRAIYEAEGLSGVYRLAECVTVPGFVGKALADLDIWTASGDVDLMVANFGTEVESRHHVSLGYARRRIDLEGIAWLVEKVREAGSRFSVGERARLYLLECSAAAVLEAVEGEETECQREFWRRFPLYGCSGSEPTRSLVLRRLLDHGREATVVDILAGMTHGGNEGPPPDLAIEALELLRANASRQLQAIAARSHDLARLIDYLAASPETDLDRLANLEWFFLPAMNILRAPTALGKAIARDPALLVDLVKAAYRRDDGQPEVQEEGSQARAQAAFDVLEKLRYVPGVEDEGSFDAAAFRRYVDHARTMAAKPEVSRSHMTDHYLGMLAAQAPYDPDGSWPHAEIRKLIEEAGSDAFEQGFYIRIVNSQGPTWRALSDGGQQEREEADRYRELADKYRLTSPRVAKLMDSIECHYLELAEDADLRAAQRQDQLD